MKTYLNFIVVSCVLYFTRTQALQCHNCYYSSIPSGFLPKKIREITSESCIEGKLPNNSSLVDCYPLSDKTLVTLCAKLYIKGVIPAWSEEFESTRSTCLELPTSVKYGCRDWEKGDLMSSSFIPDEIKGDLNFYSDSSTVQICTCQENGCNSVSANNVNVFILCLTLFVNFLNIDLNVS